MPRRRRRAITDKRSGSGLSAQIRGPVPENTATAYARTSHTEKPEDTRRTGKYNRHAFTCCRRAAKSPSRGKGLGIGTDLQMPPAPAGKPYEINSYENRPRFVSTDHDKRGPRTRMGAVGRHPLFGRRLHRPSGIRRGGNRPSARSRRLPRGNRAAAQLQKIFPAI